MIKYYQNNALVFKTRWMTNDGFYFSEKELEESVLTEYLNSRKELDEDIIFIPYTQIERITPITENQPVLLDIEVKDPENYQALVADFESEAQLEEAIKSIESHARLKQSIEIIKDKSWTRNLLYTIGTGFFGYALVMVAQEIAAGEILDLSGRRSGMKKILATVAEQLGVIGSAAVAVLLVGVSAYFTFKAYKTSITRTTVWK